MSGSGMQWGAACWKGCNGQDGCECIVRGVSLDCNLSVWDPMGEVWSGSEGLLTAVCIM